MFKLDLVARASEQARPKPRTVRLPVPAVIAEKDPQVRRELDRLRDVARRHGIDPDGGAARTA